MQTSIVEKFLIYIFPQRVKGSWIRIKKDVETKSVSVHFNYRNKDERSVVNDAVFAPVSKIGLLKESKGLIRSNRQVLSLKNAAGIYAVNKELKLVPAKADERLFKDAEQPQDIINFDEASAIIVNIRKYITCRNMIYMPMNRDAFTAK